jgi:4-amino-4-deoxy-L-arabinose transferase-like glycosyltransferase
MAQFLLTDVEQAARRTWIARGVAGIGLQLAAAAAYFLRPGAETVGVGAGFAVLSMVLFAAAWRIGGAVIPLSTEVISKRAPIGGRSTGRSSGTPLLLGILCLLISVIWSANIATQIAPAPPIAIQFAVWAFGVASIAWGVVRVRLSRRLFASFPRADLLILAGIALLAFIVRGWGLDTQIRGLIDETIYINGILRLHDAPTTGLLTSLSRLAPTTAVYTTLHAGTAALFGYDLIGLRALNVILGAAGVLALYGLARELGGGTAFGRVSALAAALMLAAFPPHIHFSRIAIPQLADTLFGTLALWFAARGWRTGGASGAGGAGAWGIAGVCLGLTGYFYEGGRLLFPAVMAVGVAIIWRRRARIMPLVIAFALVAAPIYLTMAATGTSLTRRLDDVGLNADYWRGVFADGVTLDALVTAGARVLEPLRVYVHQPDGTREFYGGDQPMILSVLVPLLLIGAGISLARPRHPMILPVLWALLGAFGNALLVVTDSHQRYIAVQPALALMIAWGACGIVQIMIGSANRARVAVTTVIVVGVAALQIAYYFGAHVPLFNAQFRAAKPYPDGADALLYANTLLESGALPPDGALVFISDPPDNRLILRRLWRYLTLDDPRVTRRLNSALGLSGGVALETYPAALTDAQIAAFPRVPTVFFIARTALEADRYGIVARLGQFFNLPPPHYSPYDIPDDERYGLLIASPAHSR